MTRTPDKNEVTKFLENSKLGKLKYERSPTITSFRQVLPCLRVKPLLNSCASETNKHDLLGPLPLNKSHSKVNGKKPSSVHLSNASFQSDKSELQLDSSLLNISSINGDSFSNDSEELNSSKHNSISSLKSNKSKKEIEKLTEDSLTRLCDKENKKSAYLNAFKSFEESFEKKAIERSNKSFVETRENASQRKDSWEAKREKNLEELLSRFKTVRISLPESKIEIPKPVIVSYEEPIVVAPKDIPVEPRQPSPEPPQSPAQSVFPTVVELPKSVVPEEPKPSILSSPAVNSQEPQFQTQVKNPVPIPSFETPKGAVAQTIQPSNLFGSDSFSSLANDTLVSKEIIPDSLTNNQNDNVTDADSVQFSFASAFSAAEFEDNSVPNAPVINIKSLNLIDYPNAPSEAIYDYYIYQRYVLFNKSKQFEETNNEKAKSIKRCFSEFNKLTETNPKDILTYILNIYLTRRCEDGNKVVSLMDEDSSFEFAVFRGCFVALNIMVSQKFTLILYNLAAVVSVLCSRIPLYRDCFLGFLYKQCPYAIPYVPVRKANETRENYLKRCGNLRNMSSDDFQLSIQKNMKFFGAIVQMNIPEEHNSLNLFYGWNYVQRFLTSMEQFQKNKLPISSCIIIEGFLSTCCHRLFERYNRRFAEVFALIKSYYLPTITQIEDQNNDLNQQAHHLLMNFINKVDKVINKQNRCNELKDFDIPDRFFMEFFPK